MYPTLFTIGSHQVQSWLVLVIVAFLVASAGAVWAARRRQVGIDVLHASLMAAIVFGTVGTHALTGIIYATSGDPAATFWDGWQAFSDLGFFLLAQLGIALYARWRGLDALNILDVWAFGAATGVPVGRFACLLAGCCYGQPTTMPWGIRYHDPQAEAFRQLGSQALHPTPLYLSGGIALLWLLLRTMLGRETRPGTVFLTAWCGYALTRLTVEWFRADLDRGSWFGGWFTSYQLVCLAVLAIAGSALILRRRPQRESVGAARAVPEGGR